jgi:hypothetical protein
MAASLLLAALPTALHAIGVVKVDEAPELRFLLDPLRREPQ